MGSGGGSNKVKVSLRKTLVFVAGRTWASMFETNMKHPAPAHDPKGISGRCLPRTTI